MSDSGGLSQHRRWFRKDCPNEYRKWGRTSWSDAETYYTIILFKAYCAGSLSGEIIAVSGVAHDLRYIHTKEGSLNLASTIVITHPNLVIRTIILCRAIKGHIIEGWWFVVSQNRCERNVQNQIQQLITRFHVIVQDLNGVRVKVPGFRRYLVFDIVHLTAHGGLVTYLLFAWRVGNCITTCIR